MKEGGLSRVRLARMHDVTAGHVVRISISGPRPTRPSRTEVSRGAILLYCSVSGNVVTWPCIEKSRYERWVPIEEMREKWKRNGKIPQDTNQDARIRG